MKELRQLTDESPVVKKKRKSYTESNMDQSVDRNDANKLWKSVKFCDSSENTTDIVTAL